ncbi:MULTISPECIES: head completion/stabilization protein [unclassified Pseudoalteromonas]|uniref:head completion/stabilization protein n=1 Tax=unclassified Pseudoalteromonas TaxID=194690 RepID=UPI001603CA51|nr:MULTISPECIES: head completion/stabilization protein [unclassified Pseudoalteromonas]MBB1333871.1 head completion/stabilization protein [Pseudoalteromonas sp. SR41-6]MBB1459592.1 head completion/stabilization protein [Pseudoalteromonas sp. SG41-8]
MSFGYEATAQESIDIDADSGWPALSTAEFRKHRRIPEFYEEAVIADSLNRSVLEVQKQIIKYIAKGNTDVSFTLIDGVPEFSESQESVYRGAVYARSHSDLMGYFSSVDQKPSGNNKADDVNQQDAILAQSNRSVRLLLSLGRAGVQSL